ncbi:MAG: biotin transporter BioY [Oscillospiraceae bacterium]|nr:biotin transporter BioY [Oscillospiraceae bacterium]
MTQVHRSASQMRTLSLVYIAVGAALLAVCSFISIPTAVPFTLQVFAVAFNLVLLGGKRGTASILVYILLGAAGVPVFAHFTGGIGALLDKSGGYILGFLFSGLIYWLFEATLGKKIAVQIAALLLGLVICYTFGTVWFIVVYTRKIGAVGLGTVLGWCVTPFVIPDLIKIAAAFVLANRLEPIIGLGRYQAKSA